MIKLKSLITEGKYYGSADWKKMVKDIANYKPAPRDLQGLHKVIQWVFDDSVFKLTDKNGKYMMDDLRKQPKLKKLFKEGVLTEGKITSDVDRAAKKHGIKFKKKVKTKITNDFTGPNQPTEKVKYDDWMDYNPQNYESQGRALISALDGKYVRMKSLKYHNGGGMIFRKDRKDKKTEFMITYARAMSGPYISYGGVKGQ